MKVLVTGGTGRIGSHVTRLLLERGDAVRILAIPNDPLSDKMARLGAEVVEGFLQRQPDLDAAVSGVDAVAHLGAALTSRDSSDEQYFEANLRGTYNMLMAVRFHAPNATRVVSASSDAVYWAHMDRPPQFLPIDETHPRVPGTIYGASKLGAEELCLTFLRAFGIPTTTVRFSATSEPWELVSPDSVFGRRLYVTPAVRTLAGKPTRTEAEEALLTGLRAVDDGTEQLFVAAGPDGRISTTNLGDARDSAAGVLCLLDHPAAVGEPFNIGPPAPYHELELVRALGERLGIPYHVIPTTAIRPSWYVSSAKARSVVGYKPRYTIFDMIEEGALLRESGSLEPVSARTPGVPTF